ncbi:MAG: [Acyl-carrier-protein] S-malonyltransferase [Firmicutes bacterium]|nr:[Acyl-carrier-protein] S-malonyltransferase [Bacillota bacterium]
MPGLAFVFPGQGAQRPGMGKELAANYAEAARIYDQADEIVGYKLSALCFEGPAEQLNKTEFAQPALLTTSLAILEVVKKHGLSPVMMAGLSLGEYTALVATGAMSLQQALPLVQHRALFMQTAVPDGKGAMAAVLGLEADQVTEICQRAKGMVDIANYNCPGQLVISGETEAVNEAGASLKKIGGRVVPLAVSVPSHSQLMRDAAIKLQPELHSVDWQEPSVPVVSNVNAQANPRKDFADLLEKQLFSPVLWEQSIRYMLNQVDYFVEIGPGSTLSGLIKKIDRSRLLGHIEDIPSLNKVIAEANHHE